MTDEELDAIEGAVERPAVVHDPDGNCPARWFVFGAHDWKPYYDAETEFEVCNWCGGRKP